MGIAEVKLTDGKGEVFFEGTEKEFHNATTAISKGINLEFLTESRLGELRALCQAKIDTAESFTTACKSIAERAGVIPAALASYVTAVVKQTEAKTKEKAEQLDLLFEELGE